MQKGIQAGHAALEYANTYGRTEEYIQFIKHDKTWIVLDGGTSRDFASSVAQGLEGGDLNLTAVELSSLKIDHAVFREPDLNFAMTAICFLADERVWNKETYPDFREYLMQGYEHMNESYNHVVKALENNKLEVVYSEQYKLWMEQIGGDNNLYLRDLLRNKRLAM